MKRKRSKDTKDEGLKEPDKKKLKEDVKEKNKKWTNYVKNWNDKLWICSKSNCKTIRKLNQPSFDSFKKNYCWFDVKLKTMKPNENDVNHENNKCFYDKIDQVIEKSKKEETEEEEKKKKINTKNRSKDSKKTKEKAERAWKVRLYPNEKERQKLNQWIGIYRWTYNQCVHYYNELISKGEKIKISHQTLRDQFVKNEALIEMNKKWALLLPWDSRDEACQDFISALKINEKVYKERLEKEEKKLREMGLKGKKLKEQLNKNVTRFQMKFKSKKKKLTESFFIRERHWNQKKGMSSWLSRIKTKEKIQIKYDTRVIKDSIGRYYVIMLKPLEPEKINHKRNKCISIDPGVRTFATGYDPQGNIIEFGVNDSNKLIKLGIRADKLKSEANKKKKYKDEFKHNHKKRQNMKKKYRKTLQRIKHRVKDFHHKVSKYLVKNYENILLPRFGTSEMVKKEDRVIGSKTVRKMLTWSHYKFKGIIQSKSKRFNSYVNICDEWYTSKTCGNCGHMKKDLGGNKTYHCDQCNLVLDRDANGARNILIKFLCKYI